MTPYDEQLAMLLTEDPVLAKQVASLPNLNAILNWAPSIGISLAGIDLIQQDEYSHDVTIPLPDSRWLVFGVT